MFQFDVLFNDLGQIGFAQILIVLLLSYQNICGGINGLATVFIANEPDYRHVLTINSTATCIYCLSSWIAIVLYSSL